MKVSVIVPVYNTEKYLGKCMASLLHQTLDGVEIIAVDDGSTDSSGSMLDEIQKKYPDRIKVFHKKNGGQASARNLALKHCSGEYIGFLDSDDYVDHDMFQQLYEKAQDTEADFVACAYRDTCLVNEEEHIIKSYVGSRLIKTPKDMSFGALVSPFLHLYRREVLLDHGIFFPEGLIYEDTAFYLNAIPFIRKVAVVEKALAARTRRGNSTMTICNGKKVAQIFPVLQKSVDFYRENGYDQEFGRELEYFCVRVLLCSSMERISRVKNRKESWDLFIQTLEFLKKQFPQYRKNPYMHHGLQHLYMKSFCRLTAWIYFPLFRLKARFERRYE